MFNLVGTYEFFSLEDARRAADEGRLLPGAVVVVGRDVYMAMYYDAEKRIVLMDKPRPLPPPARGDPVRSFGRPEYTLLPAPRRSKRGRR